MLHFEEQDADVVLAAYRASRPLGSQTAAGLATFAGSESVRGKRGYRGVPRAGASQPVAPRSEAVSTKK